jgi:hypothetical protein
MATNKPRITVTLGEPTYAVLKSIADLGNGTMSGFVSEMLESALPTLERMAATFQAIKNAQTTERGKFLASMDRAQAALEPAVMEAVGQFDLFLGKIETAVGALPNSAERSADASAERQQPHRVTASGDFSDPRPVTRGSTPLKRKKSAASTTTAKARSGKASGLES